jgi:hypothetical protein
MLPVSRDVHPGAGNPQTESQGSAGKFYSGGLISSPYVGRARRRWGRSVVGDASVRALASVRQHRRRGRQCRERRRASSGVVVCGCRSWWRRGRLLFLFLQRRALYRTHHRLVLVGLDHYLSNSRRSVLLLPPFLPPSVAGVLLSFLIPNRSIFFHVPFCIRSRSLPKDLRQNTASRALCCLRKTVSTSSIV